MRCWFVSAAATVMLVAAVGASACAHAQPEPAPPGPAEIAAPQTDSSCADSLDGALTLMGDGPTGTNRRLLRCADGTWQAFADPYPSSERWLTTGPPLIVHGQGRRNPEVKAGTWTGIPQTADAGCSVESIDVLGPGRLSEPQTSSAEPGQPLTVDVSDHMFTVQLRGFCLWQRVG